MTVHEEHLLRLRSFAAEMELEADYYARQIGATRDTLSDEPTLGEAVAEVLAALARLVALVRR
jgi:hypothetical protein